MAETLQFDLVSPERLLASVAATEVLIPGDEGDMTAMPDHAPTITTLRPGILRVVADGVSTEYAVTGGFAEITATGVSVLAERAVPLRELTQEMLDQFVTDAATLRETSTGAQLDALAKGTADIAAMAAAAGLTVRA